MENHESDDKVENYSPADELYRLWTGVASKSFEYYSSALSSTMKISKMICDAGMYTFAVFNGYDDWLKRKEAKEKE